MLTIMDQQSSDQALQHLSMFLCMPQVLFTDYTSVSRQYDLVQLHPCWSVFPVLYASISLTWIQYYTELLRYVHICIRLRTRHAERRQTRMSAKKWFVVRPTLRMYFSLKYWLQTDSVQLFTECLSHKQMLFAVLRLYVHINISLEFCMPHSAFAYRCGCGFTLWLTHFLLFTDCHSLNHSIYSCSLSVFFFTYEFLKGYYRMWMVIRTYLVAKWPRLTIGGEVEREHLFIVRELFTIAMNN